MARPDAPQQGRGSWNRQVSRAHAQPEQVHAAVCQLLTGCKDVTTVCPGRARLTSSNHWWQGAAPRPIQLGDTQ